jgi:hypothetical protein
MPMSQAQIWLGGPIYSSFVWLIWITLPINFSTPEADCHPEDGGSMFLWNDGTDLYYVVETQHSHHICISMLIVHLYGLMHRHCDDFFCGFVSSCYWRVCTVLARWGRIISQQCRSWLTYKSVHSAVTYMSTLYLGSRAVCCRSWAICVGDTQKTRIRSVVGQVL